MNPDSPLLRLIRDLIRQEGPIGLDRYMSLALSHPALGYYATRDPFGAAGDFVTAPEISQMFGEMLGLWGAEVWHGMHQPAVLRLAELGPGRGSLMADFLRAAKILPGFRGALDLHLVETSPVLRRKQAETLGPSGLPHHWHDRFDSVPDGPALILANEFFDALPVRHYQRMPRGWCERLVGLGEAEQLVFGLAPEPEPSLKLKAPEGTIVEVAAEALRIVGGLATRIATQGGAALILDYGHKTSGFGETLQAMRGHRFADPLLAPGEVDLTTHVDFAALGRAARAAGATVHGPVSQGHFLKALGIAARAEQLAKNHSERAGTIMQALRRLTTSGTPEQPGMGDLFKVIALTPPGAVPPPGF